MLGFQLGGASSATDTLSALGRSLAIIEFDPQGKILAANANFCAALGYGLDEIKGRRHSLFVDPAYARTAEYSAFSYNPVRDGRGAVTRVVKVATAIRRERSRGSVRRAASRRLAPAGLFCRSHQARPGHMISPPRRLLPAKRAPRLRH